MAAARLQDDVGKLEGSRTLTQDVRVDAIHSAAGVCTSVVATVCGTRLVFDAGLATPAALSAECMFISHGHMDHISGLPSIISQREMTGTKTPLRVFALAACVEAIERILVVYREISGSALRVELRAVGPGDVIVVNKRMRVQVVGMTHRAPCVGYVVFAVSAQLRDELRGLPSSDVAARVRAGECVTVESTRPVFAFTGDTTFDAVLASDAMCCAEVLVTECTYVDGSRESARSRGHVALQDIVEAQGALGACQWLVLAHISAKYSREHILEAVSAVVPPTLRARVLVALDAHRPRPRAPAGRDEVCEREALVVRDDTPCP